MNFVSSTTSRRTRTHSVTAVPGTQTNTQARSGASTTQLASPVSHLEWVEPPSCGVTVEIASDSTGHTPPVPLSASHDTAQLKEELTSVARRRSCSFTGQYLLHSFVNCASFNKRKLSYCKV